MLQTLGLVFEVKVLCMLFQFLSTKIYTFLIVDIVLTQVALCISVLTECPSIHVVYVWCLRKPD